MNPPLGHADEVSLGPVAKTLLIPLWARAEEMRRARPIVRDPSALSICESLDFDFSIFRNARGTQAGCVLRGLLYDDWARAFLASHPSGTVVELGAGLGTRFERINQAAAHWVDVDLPDVIALRRRYLRWSPRRTFVPGSVLDSDWIAAVRRAPPPYFFISEGMLMYLEAGDVRRLLARIADAFGPSAMAFDSISPAVVRNQRLHDSMRHMMEAPFRWGIRDVREVETWDSRCAVDEVATLPDIVRRYRACLPRAHRLAAGVARLIPPLAGAYRLCRVSFGPNARARSCESR